MTAPTDDTGGTGGSTSTSADTSAAGLAADLTVPGRVTARLDVAAGSVVAVVGPNGAGKSSLLGALAGTVPADGTLRVAGRDLTRLTVPERRVGLVPQDAGLFGHLSALENVAFGPRARGVPRRRARAEAADWLARLGVGHLADRRPAQLSGGQARRVAVARALVTAPDLLLLDEPFAGLDVTVAAALRGELVSHLARAAAERGTVTLLVTHDPVDALTLADTVVVLEAGRVVQTGEPHAVAAAPTSEHVGRLVGLNVVHRPSAADGTGEGEVLTFPPSAVVLDPEEPRSSARLRWRGTVRGVTRTGGVVRVLVETTDGASLLADVTPTSAERLLVSAGSEIWLSVKETAVTAATMRP
ncbi:ABC transporter ATP-binding protein [Nocardioides sp. GY 10127]|uniref:ABC transporter ATP-binding protein n=1 Tax=Nocardioides sp. GY 10127 TaxID=2569762 RepID=UPI0010A93422|nr:ABC transporter ATP-binding protein [Nocardioides sp. GY 10127]TIC81727.1 ABC transporter ATP-binding protein [Nocardioides sp. GY 10127]